MSIITVFVTIWTSIAQFFVNLFTSITPVFWNASTAEPTFVGVMAIIMAGVALVLLVFNLIRSFFAMRG